MTPSRCATRAIACFSLRDMWALYPTMSRNMTTPSRRSFHSPLNANAPCFMGLVYQPARRTGRPAGAAVSDSVRLVAMRPGGIAIIDFGSQVTQLIARRVREASVYSEILPPSVTPAQIEAFAPRGIILSGGPASVYERGAPKLQPFLRVAPYPMLGICYG